MTKLNLNENTTKLCLEIKSYPKNRDESAWCDIRIAIDNYYLHFDKTDEYLEYGEVSEIATTLKKLLKGQIVKKEHLNFTEPEISMIFYGARTIKKGAINSRGWIYIGDEPIHSDIALEIQIEFPSEKGVYCQETWSCALERKDIEEFYNQWLAEIGETPQSFAPEIDKKIKLCSCSFTSYGKTYYYQTDDDRIEIGDTVKVPVGDDNQITTVFVENIEYYEERDLPLPLEKIKKIISVE